uniref:CCHC-type domain-containing protein n=1 Tax=Phytophthora ramorum TaxID=164328 RepID=H3GZY4_PHYRM
MADRSKVPSHLPKFTGKRGKDVREWLFQVENACRINGIAIEDASTRLPGIAGSAMEKPASGWFLHWSSTIRNEEHTWGIFREHVLQHFEASNYQSVLRERLQRLKQTADIETYNGDYSALIFRVEGMSALDQVLNYANGLKPRTRSYVKLENPETLSDAMDLAVKYEGKPFRGKGRFKPRAKSESKETRTCYFCKNPGHIKADCYAWKYEQAKQGNDKPRQ